jgi:phosphohistidine phosphatase SixA
MRAKTLGLFTWLGMAAAIFAFSAAAEAQMLVPSSNLINGLRQGGFVLVMRHANSPAQPPAKGAADPENVKLERQLDQTGRADAQKLGGAMKALRIPVGAVFSSPTYRALQTVKLAGFGQPRIFADLDENAAGMAANVENARIAWLKSRIGETPRAGTNTIIVTHAPNIKDAFDVDAAAGEAIVFKPDGKGGAEPVARIKVNEWPAPAK